MSAVLDLFQEATKRKLRFRSTQGQTNLSTEDLWDLPLDSAQRASLQSVARATSADLKASAEEDFVSTKTSANQVDELRLSIVKHIIAVRLEERAAAANAAERKAKKSRLTELLAQKQDQELASKSAEEIQKLIADLE